VTAPRGEAAPTARQRPIRGAPTDIPFGFPDEGLARALASERTEPGWLRDERRAAAKAYASLPVETNPLYTTYVDLRPADLDGVRPYVRTAAAPRMERGTPVSSVPEGTAGIIEIREDVVAALALAPEAAAAGVVLETFAIALKRDPKGLRVDLEGGGSLPADDKLAQLTRGYWSQGVRLIVPDGVRIDRPILLRWAAGAPGRALLTRTLIRLGAGADASIVEELVPAGAPVHGRGALLTGTTEVVLGRGASLAVASIQEMGPNQVVFGHRHATLGDDSALHWALGQLGGRLTRSRVDNVLAGNRSSVEQVEIVFGAGEQLFDLTSYTRHVGRDTTGNLLAKGVLMDAARSFMKGLITIEKSAVGTDSFLGEFGMNLSKRARAVAIPSLEIDQPDCRRAMHSSSVGPIDEAQVFYLESRGIPADEGRKFIVLGFLEPVVARVSHPEAEDRLRRLLDEKWSAHTGTTAAA
jgi:Fe-S cluster assembly scaffold protein SufB